METLTEHTHIQYTLTKKVFTVSPRDVVALSHCQVLADDEIWLMAQSVEHPAVPHGKYGAKHVRARLEIGGWALRPVSEGRATHATYVLRTDPMGKLPASVVKNATTKQALCVKKLDGLIDSWLGIRAPSERTPDAWKHLERLSVS